MIIALKLLVGLVLLYYGAEFLVRGAASLAFRLGVSALLVGLTVVAFGTSMPEMVVSVIAGFAGRGDIAVGNVVGSNIFNIAVILGLAAVIHPMKVHLSLIRRDVPIMIAVTLLLAVLLRDNMLGRVAGIGLFAGLVTYLLLSVHWARLDQAQAAGFADELPKPTSRPWLDPVLILLGLGLLVAGSRFLVSGAVELARVFHISEAVIGLTIVAAGTSLPELATSVVAALRKQADIAIGNIVGSNIFNILGILGVAATLAPLEALGVRQLDNWVMVGVSVLLFPLMWTGFRVVRWEGALLLAVYGGYLWTLWPKG